MRHRTLGPARIVGQAITLLAVLGLCVTAVLGAEASAAPRLIGDDLAPPGIPDDEGLPRPTPLPESTPLNAAPEHTGWFQCAATRTWTYAFVDFTDADDLDVNMSVTLLADTEVGLRVFGMDQLNFKEGKEGDVYWYEDLTAYGGMTVGSVIAIDEHGASSGWIPVSC